MVHCATYHAFKVHLGSAKGAYRLRVLLNVYNYKVRLECILGAFRMPLGNTFRPFRVHLGCTVTRQGARLGHRVRLGCVEGVSGDAISL